MAHPCSSLLLVLTLTSTSLALADSAPAPAAPVEAPAEGPVRLQPDNLNLLRGRWQGEWQLPDGSRGQLRLQIQSADATRITGTLRYQDTAWGELENLPFDSEPRWVDGQLQLQPGASAAQLQRIGSGYRLSWSSTFPMGGQPVQLRLSRGLVPREAPPPLGAALQPVAAADPGSPLPDGWQQSGAFMQIYVRAWRDSNGDGIGDLRGLTASLDYLQDLGVRGIWLMPVNTSQDHDHGYAVMDYRGIEAAYGSEADLRELLQQAHRRGIGVILDYVMNHSAAMNPLFEHAASSPQNPLRDWYVWSDSKPEDWNIYGRNPWYKVDEAWYFAGFSGSMPDWNLRQPAVVNYHLDNLRYWLNRGVDGFRFDAVGNLYENGRQAWESQPENYPLMARVRQLLDQYQRRWMVCEAPHDPLGFARACGSAFAFGLNQKLVRAGLGSPGAVSSLARQLSDLPPDMAILVSNHDHFAGRRLFDQLKGDVQAYRLVAATYLSLPGIPFIYYGEEIGMAGVTGMAGDRELRGPMSWGPQASASEGLAFTRGTPFRAQASNIEQFNVRDQLQQPDSLHSLYRSLLRLRSAHPALARGQLQQVQAAGSTLSFQRVQGKSRVVALFNYGAEPASVSSQGLPPSVALQVLHGAQVSVRSDAAGQISVSLPARSWVLLRY